MVSIIGRMDKYIVVNGGIILDMVVVHTFGPTAGLLQVHGLMDIWKDVLIIIGRMDRHILAIVVMDNDMDTVCMLRLVKYTRAILWRAVKTDGVFCRKDRIDCIVDRLDKVVDMVLGRKFGTTNCTRANGSIAKCTVWEKCVLEMVTSIKASITVRDGTCRRVERIPVNLHTVGRTATVPNCLPVAVSCIVVNWNVDNARDTGGWNTGMVPSTPVDGKMVNDGVKVS